MPDEALHPDLQNWLDTATKELCDAAKERVRDEISAHYADSLAGALDAGHNSDEACRLALEALGDPEEARRAFRRAHLTEGEVRELKQDTFSIRTSPGWAVWTWTLLQICCAACFGWMFGSVTVALLLLTMGLFCPMVDALLVPRLLTRKHRTRALLWRWLINILGLNCLYALYFGPSLMAWLEGDPSETPVFWLGGYLLPIVPLGLAHAVRCGRFVRKLRRPVVREELELTGDIEPNA